MISSFLLSCKPNHPQPAGFRTETGFTLTMVANEPLIKDPVVLEFDEAGNALVLEMPGYPFEDRQSRIVTLTDKDQDGVYDTQIVFTENLRLAPF